MDQRTRKLMTMNKARTEQERRWKRTYTSVESRVRAEENSLAWFVNRRTEEMLEMVKVPGHSKVSDFVGPEQLKRGSKLGRNGGSGVTRNDMVNFSRKWRRQILPNLGCG